MAKIAKLVQNRAVSDQEENVVYDDNDDEQQAAVIPKQHSEEDDDGDENSVNKQADDEDESEEEATLTQKKKKKKDKEQASADTNNWFNDMMTDKEQGAASQQIRDVLGNLNVESNDESDEKIVKASDFTVKRRLDMDDTAVTTSPDKKAKVIGGGASGGKNTTLFGKIFEDDDEILLLDEFIKFRSQTRSDDQNKFLKAIEGNLTLTFTASHIQLREKMRRFKNKYIAQEKKGQTNFSDPHLDLIYRLSHKAFGPVDVQENDDEMVQETKKDGGDADYWTLYPKLCHFIELEARVHFPVTAYNVKEFVKMTIFKLGEKKAKKFEKEWGDYGVIELQLYAKRIQVLSKQSKAVADVLRNGSLSID